MSEHQTWSEWITWSTDRDPMAVPPMVRPGDVVQSDLVIRPQKIGKSRHPAVVKDHIWTVIDGESFMISPPEPVLVTHMVASRFRIWLGEGGLEAAQHEEWGDPDRFDFDAPGIDEEEERALRWLMEQADD